MTAPQPHFQLARARHGAVAAGNPDGAAAGITMLEAGGNAFDALVATAFAMGVVEPLDNGLGGGGFAVLHQAAGGETHSLDFMSAAPLAAHYDLYQIDAPDVGYRIMVRDRANELGHRSVAVPGAAAGLAEIARRFGALPLGECLAPAIALAEGGFAMAKKPVLRLQRTLDVLGAFDAARELFLLPNGGIPAEGEMRRNPDYASTLRILARDGADALYQGEIASRIFAEMRAHDGFLDADDLRSYRAIWRTPARGAFAGRQLRTMAPPSSGFLVLRGLNALATAPGNSREEQRARAMLEMFQARAGGLGDPAFSRRARALMLAATESAETSSLSTMDTAGNAASLTYSLNTHSGVVVPGTGMLLNNQMLLFDPWPASPNSVVGGKRPASSMMPTVVLAGEGAELAIGASGSTRIASALMQVMDRVFNEGADLHGAVTAPRLHAEGHRLMADADVQAVATSLAERLDLELALLPGRDSTMGSVQAVRRDGTRMEAMGDPRSGAVGRVC